MTALIHVPLAELVETYPDLKAVFQVHHINVHEQKNVNLAQLMQDNNIPRADFLEALKRALIVSACDHYKAVDVNALTHDIIKRFHEPHRAQVHGLITDARYIEKKYAEHPHCPQGLSALLVSLFNDLDGHMDQEELFLFPALVSAGSFNMFPQIAVAHHSHDRHINMMDKLNMLTNNFTFPADASVQWQELYENLLEFMLQLTMHIAIENRFLLNN
jgi:regulator of cell morphogenesis and NO signaling